MRRAAFGIYAAALFIATHWPRLDVRVAGLQRSDLLIHAGAFAAWYFLLFLAGFFGDPRCTPRRALLLPAAVAAAYAAFDESLQLIPTLGRHAAWDDLLANLAGIVMGLALAGLWTARSRFSTRRGRGDGEQSAA